MPSKRSRQAPPPNWQSLYDGLVSVYRAAGKDRMLATLGNFQDRKEAICRKLGVVSEADVARIASSLRKSVRT